MKIKVLSLFDGHSGGRIAFDKLGVDVTYHASEIDKYASFVARYLYQDTVFVGDVMELEAGENIYSHYDWLIGGSPCTSLSFAGKQVGLEAVDLPAYLKHKELVLAGKAEFKGQSFLFWEYVRLLRDLKPKFFLLENVRMKKEFQDAISQELGVEPVVIDSNLQSAQNRHRLYWVGALQADGSYKQVDIPQPEDKGILLKDIVHEFADELVNLNEPEQATPSLNTNPSGRGMNGAVRSVYKKKSATLTTNKGEGSKILIDNINRYIVPFDKTLRILDKEVQRGKVSYFRKDSQDNRMYFIHDKAITLCGEAGGGAAKMGMYLFGEVKIIQNARGNNTGGLRGLDGKTPTLTSSSLEQNNKLPLGCASPDRVEKRQNSQRFNEGKKFYTLTVHDRHGVLVEGYIRKLTPVEAERLQTLADNTTKYGKTPSGEVVEISNAQRYRMLGNGWTNEVIQHILMNTGVAPCLT